MSIVPVDVDAERTAADDEAPLPPSAALGNSPVNSVIRPELWVHWTITVLCFAAWGGMLYVGDATEQAGTGLRDILGIRSGRVTTFFSTIMLLWAGQLSLLIYWYRRKSRNDFQGRYRVWLWIGAMLQVFLAIAATGAHVPFSEYVQDLWPLEIPRYGILCWLVPVATLSLALYRLLRIELKRHRSGHFLLRTAGLAGAIAAASLVIGPLIPERVRDLVQIASATLAHLGLATALLMHARYVIHISNEAPRKERATRRLLQTARRAAEYLPMPKTQRLGVPRLAAGMVAAFKGKLPKPRLPKLPRIKLAQAGKKEPVSKTSSKAHRQPASKAKNKRPAPKPAPASKQAAKTRRSSRSAAETKPATENKPAVEARPEAKTDSVVETKAVPVSRKNKKKNKTSRPQPTSQPQPESVDAPAKSRKQPSRSLDAILDEYGSDEELDADALRGLSKKQRRRLRKKQRELQRAGR